MRLHFTAIAAALCLAAVVQAGCPNQCSGHGTCDVNDRCQCFQTPGLKGLYRDAWTGADCSLRVCPYGIGHDAISDATQSLLLVNSKSGEPEDIAFLPADGDSQHKLRLFLNGGFLVKQDIGVEFKVVSVSTDEIKYQSKWSTDRYYNAESTASIQQALAESRATATAVLRSNKATGLYVYWDVEAADLDAATQKIFPGDVYYANITYNQGVSTLISDHNTFHSNVECSGRGACDRQRGECKCYAGFTGDACQRTTCPNDCSGHGNCQALKYFVEEATGVDYTALDGSQEFGCKCDAGFRGADCSQVECPSGDDPLNGLGAADGKDCSGRGKCDYTTGTCTCFKGYVGERCETQTTFV